jgi:DNA oxidative demethylase
MDLFENIAEQALHIADGAVLLRGFALHNIAQILADLNLVLSQSPLRHMVTPGGFTMSVAMTNCGDLGWVSDRKGYQYATLDPNTGAPWQAMPVSFLQLANNAAAEAGYANFVPDACLINQYKVGARMGLHQDKDEQDFSQPIVSVSLGVPATFLFGGLKRSDKPSKMLLQHGDIIAWGGKSRLNYHGIMPLQPNNHAAFGACRFNLTFRKAI